MASTLQPNKSIQDPAAGDPTWNIPLNANFTAIDQAFGSTFPIYVGQGNTTALIGGASSVNSVYWYTAQQFTIQSGTGGGAVALTSNVTITLPSSINSSGTMGGAWIVRNLITSSNQGAYTITILGNGGSGTGVTIANGQTALVYTDGTNVYYADTNFKQTSLVTVSATATLNTAVFGQVTQVSGSSAYTVTFPTPVGNSGSSFQLFISATAAITLATPSGAFLTPFGASTASPIVTVNGNNALYTFLSNGTNWYYFQSPVASNQYGRVSPRVTTSANITSPWAWNSDANDQLEITALANNLTINADAGSPVDGQKVIFRIKDNLTTQTFTASATATTLTVSTSVTLVTGAVITVTSTGAAVGTITSGGTGTSFALTGGVITSSQGMTATPPGYTLTWTTGSSQSFEAVGVVLPTTTTPGKLGYVGCIYNSTQSRWDAVAVNTQA